MPLYFVHQSVLVGLCRQYNITYHVPTYKKGQLTSYHGSRHTDVPQVVGNDQVEYSDDNHGYEVKGDHNEHVVYLLHLLVQADLTRAQVDIQLRLLQEK